MIRRISLGASIVGLTVAASCASLPDIPANTCGNRIVERGEDCDTFGSAALDTSCRAPGTADECRFECNPAPATAAGHRCPPGWGCGTDFICRLPSGQFQALGGAVAADSDRLAMGDFDGDGLKDVLSPGPRGIDVFYGDNSNGLGQVFTLPVANAFPAVGQLTTHGRSDIAFTSNGAVAVWRGQADRTLATTVYPTIPIDATVRVLIIPDALPTIAGAQIFLFVGAILNSVVVPTIVLLDGNRAEVPFFSFSHGPTELAGEPLVAQFVEDIPFGTSPCSDVVLAFTGENVVHVMTPCRGYFPNFEDDTHPGVQLTFPDVALPAGSTVASGLQHADLNGDGHLDLVIDAKDAAGKKTVVVAFGLGDGTFHSTLPLPPPGSANNRANVAALLASYPLAIGQLTEFDQFPDVVLPTGIILTTYATDPGTVIPAPTGVVWSEAHILDLNSNGHPDVIAGGQRSVDFYSGTGTTLLNHSSYLVAGNADRFAFGDFDGDFFPDVAFRESGNDVASDSLKILFGRFFAAPEAPVEVGSLATIEQVVAGPLAGYLADAVADLAVVSRSLDKTEFLSVINGSTDRVLQSPFLFTRSGPHGSVRSGICTSFAIGQFTNAPKSPETTLHADVAALGYEQTLSPDRTVLTDDERLFLAPANGEALLDRGKGTASVSLETYLDGGAQKYDWQDAKVASIDLNPLGQPGTDAFVVFATSVHPAPSALFVGTVVNGTFQVAPPLLSSAFVSVRRLLVSDVDGDGASDLIVLGEGPQKARTALVFWNRRTGGFDDASVSTVSLPASAGPLVDVVALNIDSDAGHELALLTASGVYAGKANAGAISVADAPIAGLPGGGSITAGDVDGDGLEDLVIAGAAQIQVFRALPVTK